MKETMHDCYLSQFKCMTNIMAQEKDILKEFIDFYKAAAPDRLYLMGSGTSRNACAAAAPFMERVLGLEVTTIIPSTFGKFYGKKPLVIAVSQSGRSTNTIAAIQAVRAQGIPVITLTDPKDTPVGRAGDLAVHLAAEDEQIGPRTRGYAATVLTLYLMALEVALALGTIDAAGYDKAMAAFSETFAQGDSYYAACQAFYDKHLDNLKKVRKYIFTGKGVTARVAEESALKVLETVCYPAIGYEYEEFLHGPVCFADEELAVFMSLSDDEDRARMLKSAGLIGDITENCYLITHDPAVKGDKVLLLPCAAPEYTAVFLHILFAQLISARLTEDMGRERHPGVKEIFSNMGTKATEEA